MWKDCNELLGTSLEKARKGQGYNSYYLHYCDYPTATLQCLKQVVYGISAISPTYNTINSIKIAD